MALHNIYDAAERGNAVAEVARVLKPGGHVLIRDIRHTWEYAEELRRGGVADAAEQRSVWSYVGTLFTFGALRAGLVIGQKPGIRQT
jgi:ubiquinone/menaquinone biosynthesis C-methylase UbiE